MDQELIRDFTKKYFSEPNTKCTLISACIHHSVVNKDGLKAFTLYTDAFMDELVRRTEALARSQNSPQVTLNHLQLIMAQLLLDFN